MRKTKEQKAITLIALIITIVVLLILAVVAINAVTGDGIIQHAVNAKTEYEKAQDEENSILSYYEQYLENKGDIGPWKQDGNIIYMTDSNGKRIQLNIGTIVQYEPIEEGGDISYIVNSENVGITEEQKFQVTNDIVWKVLGIENGKILLVASDDIAPIDSENLNIKNINLYLNGIEELNNICNIYGRGEGAESARSINVDDVNKITGYNPETKGTDFTGLNEYETIVTYTREEDKITYTPTWGEEDDGIVRYGENGAGNIITDGTFYYIEEEEWKNKISNVGESKAFKTNVYRYSASQDSTCADTRKINMNMSSNSEEFKMLFKNSKTSLEAQYFLASRVLRIHESYNLGVYYGLRKVSNGGVGAILDMNSEGELETGISSCGVRPVVILKSDVEFSDTNNDNVLEIN